MLTHGCGNTCDPVSTCAGSTLEFTKNTAGLELIRGCVNIKRILEINLCKICLVAWGDGCNHVKHL